MTERAVALALVGAFCAHSGVFEFSGVLDPATNPNLTYWDQLNNTYTLPIPGPADQDRAFNIAVHTITVAGPGVTTFESLGYGQGGFDSVLSVFEGSGTSAVYVHHGFGIAAGDFSFDLNLALGTYTLTVGMFLNEPCAAGFCFLNGDFGDGFTNLVNFEASRSERLFYDVAVTTEGAGSPVPESAPAMLVVLGFAAALARNRFLGSLRAEATHLPRWSDPRTATREGISAA